MLTLLLLLLLFTRLLVDRVLRSILLLHCFTTHGFIFFGLHFFVAIFVRINYDVNCENRNTPKNRYINWCVIDCLLLLLAAEKWAQTHSVQICNWRKRKFIRLMIAILSNSNVFGIARFVCYQNYSWEQLICAFQL